MGNNYYTATIFLTVFAMLIMMLSVSYNVAMDWERKWGMRLMFGIIIITSLCEWCGNMLDGTPAMWISLHVFVKVVELSASPFIGLLYGKSISQDVPLGKILVGLFLANAGLAILSAFNGMVFYVDAQNFYHHGEFYWVYSLSYAVSIGLYLFQSLRVYKRYQQSGGGMLSVLTLFLLAGIIIQEVGNVKIIWLTVGIATIMLYKLYGDILQQVDGLTGLINRWGYDRYTSNFRGKGAILFFDVDRFKRVNDTYGHAFGDESLQVIADCLRQSFDQSGKCFRIGGDEFCVILEKDLDKTGKLVQDFAQLIQQRREAEPKLPKVSTGWVIFDTSKMNLCDAAAKADAEMYCAKEHGREEPETGRYVRQM